MKKQTDQTKVIKRKTKTRQIKKSSDNPVHVNDSNKGKLKCLLLNARSIINKKEELEAVAYEKNPDFILITETWAKDKHSKGELNLNGYDCHRNDRSETERGGGCIIYAKAELQTVMIENLFKT